MKLYSLGLEFAFRTYWHVGLSPALSTANQQPVRSIYLPRLLDFRYFGSLIIASTAEGNPQPANVYVVGQPTTITTVQPQAGGLPADPYYDGLPPLEYQQYHQPQVPYQAPYPQNNSGVVQQYYPPPPQLEMT
jgi:hypothetical protein